MAAVILASDQTQLSMFTGDKKAVIADLEQALYASKIISYAQGFMLMREVRQEFSPLPPVLQR